MSFNNYAEIMRVLLKGAKLSVQHETQFKYVTLSDEGTLVDDSGFPNKVTFNHPEHWDYYKDPAEKDAWYTKDLEDGVLCCVDDGITVSTLTSIKVITHYQEEVTYPFIDKRNIVWKHAEPLSIKELEAFLETAKRIL